MKILIAERSKYGWHVGITETFSVSGKKDVENLCINNNLEIKPEFSMGKKIYAHQKEMGKNLS